eukprot:4585988-Amphidinium_carterae.2
MRIELFVLAVEHWAASDTHTHTKAWYEGKCSTTLPTFDAARVYASVSSLHKCFDTVAPPASAIHV